MKRLRIRKKNQKNLYCDRGLIIGGVKCAVCKYNKGVEMNEKGILFNRVVCDYPAYRYRSSVTGRLVSKEFAAEHPRETVRERI